MADADWDTIVSEKSINDGGFVGDLLTLARAHIDDAVTNNEITQEQAGMIYTEMIPSAFKEGINYFLQIKQIRLGIIPSTLSK